ncbi:MAG TPA: DNA mismatch repair endonuclease MutL [Fusobacterium sp.]|uniref:DNA mismatch repair endonuclease MutL n=1 Tax=Fusobacterium sp. TaxID=68766 RepID=UPI002F405C72
MGKIHILEESVSNAIAAGEVVENPASLVKELLENSLDAGSKNIYLFIREGGLFVEIRDDGVGMSREDVLLSVERHATSKISKKEDLFSLKSYGFRGEALSSIAAVSKLSITSCESGSNMGSKMTVLGGKVTGIKDFPRTQGTDIVIQNLFFNTPARLKFLRKSSTEYMQIKDIVLKEALANPEVKIRLEIDGKESIYSSGNGLENTILEIFGRNALKNLKKFAYGYVGNEKLYRSSRDSLFIFVNGRPVKAKLIEEAIIDSYYTKLMKGKYPFACVFLRIPASEIDVNVHPSKKIVKFANASEIYSLVRNSIEEIFQEEKEFSFAQFEVKEEPRILEIEKSMERNFIEMEKREEILKQEFSWREALQEEGKTYFQEDKTEKIPLFDLQNDKIPVIKDEHSFIREENISPPHYDFKILAQIYDTFLLVERRGIFEIYDQHIIHERVLYEELKEKYYGHSIQKQRLLVPLRLDLDPREKEIFFEHEEQFAFFGIEGEDFGGNEIVIRSVPAVDFKASMEEVIREMLEQLSHEKEKDIRESMIISMSCKGAIKANQKLILEDMYPLIQKLHEIGEYTCPHGRPIIMQISLEELEKWFKRK